ncbi:MAG: type II toxin-antitoxin system RelE/ParE family toxin [Desulfovibrionaceae bacterium]|nr:type II toxin-antitoxin system RelE/ParE family toxin [Desulfovibrionaceae bacterium]
MLTIVKTNIFSLWLESLKDRKAKIKILRRIERAEDGNLGDHKNVAGPIWEIRIDYGPGYRLYYAQTETAVYLLLCGGDKTTQKSDIKTAETLWRQIRG